MEQTRIDSQTFQRDVKKASELIAQALKLMSPYLPMISDAERAVVPRARTGFFNVVPQLIAAAADFKELAQMSGFEAAAVKEDAANVQSIAPLVVQAREFAQLVADASLVWTGEAFVQSIALYRVAGSLVRTHPPLRGIVDALAPIFSVTRKKPTAET